MHVVHASTKYTHAPGKVRGVCGAVASHLLFVLVVVGIFTLVLRFVFVEVAHLIKCGLIVAMHTMYIK